MVPVSVVIITKNEAKIIASSIRSAQLITDDVVVVDSGSTDETANIAEALGCRVYHRRWDGYGANKNKGIALAKYNWILSMDADEVADQDLVTSLHRIDFQKREVVYDIRFKTYFGQKLIRFGSWGRDHHLRLFNRSLVQWSACEVHETLVLPRPVIQKKLDGYLEHFSVTDFNECSNKAAYYGKLSAKKYFNSGKKAGAVKLYLSPVFNFVKNYVLRLGFLDGREGLCIAQMAFKHTWFKYHHIDELAAVAQPKPMVIKERLAFDY